MRIGATHINRAVSQWSAQLAHSSSSSASVCALSHLAALKIHSNVSVFGILYSPPPFPPSPPSLSIATNPLFSFLATDPSAPPPPLPVSSLLQFKGGFWDMCEHFYRLQAIITMFCALC
jgi:hypothetical protein